MGIGKIVRSLCGKKRPHCAAVIVAAGKSSRMGGVDKLSAELGGKPVLLRTLQVFQRCKCIDEIVLVTRQERLLSLNALCQANELDKVRSIVAGGAARIDSVLAGIESVSAKAKLVAVHDGARPLVTEELIERTVAKAALTGAAAPAVHLKDTVKRVERGVILETPDRAGLAAIQTPQVFDRDLIEGALYQAKEQELALTDDCAAVERLGMKVHLTEGSDENLKLTTPIDLLLAELIWKERQG